MNRPTGIAYAEAVYGMKLPVVDVTHPAFAITASAREIEAASPVPRRDAGARSVPGPVRRWLVSFLVRRSTLLRGAIPGQGDHLRVALRETTPDDLRMVGDAIRDSEVVRLSGRETGFQFRPLGREGFEALARQAGWEVEAAVDEPACLAFRLVKG